MVYIDVMPIKRTQVKQVRRSVTLSSEVAKVVDRIAKKQDCKKAPPQ